MIQKTIQNVIQYLIWYLKIFQCRITFFFSRIHFLIKNKILLWFLLFRIRQFNRLLTSNSSIPGLIIGIIALIPVVVNDDDLVELFKIAISENNIVLMAILSAMILLIITFFTRWTFFNLPPDQYASFTIEGVNPSSAILIVSYSIWKECHYVGCLSLFKKYELLLKYKQNSSDYLIEKFKSHPYKRINRINKIDSMIVSLAKGLGVSAYKLSDHLFHFSPEIYSFEMDRLINLCIQNIYNQEEKNLKWHSVDNDIEDIKDSLLKRKSYQVNNILFKDEHDFVIGLSRGLGLTSAIRNYCTGLGYAVSVDRKLNIDKLNYIFHKRKLWSGIDLHSLVYNFSILSNDSNLKYVLEIIAGNKNDNIGSKKREAIKHLGSNINQYIKSEREGSGNDQLGIFKNFIKFIDKQTLSRKEKVVFITQGFSSVVNKTLSYFIQEIVDNETFQSNFKNIEIHIYIY